MMRIRIHIFTLIRIRIRIFTLMRIRFMFLIKVIQICDHWSTDPLLLHILSFQTTLHRKPAQILNFRYNTDSDSTLLRIVIRFPNWYRTGTSFATMPHPSNTGFYSNIKSSISNFWYNILDQYCLLSQSLSTHCMFLRRERIDEDCRLREAEIRRKYRDLEATWR